MALEYSEVMAAAAMFFTENQLRKAASSNEELGEWILKAKEKAKTKIEFGSSGPEFIKFMKPTPAAFKEAIVGISSAIAIKKWIKPLEGGSDKLATKVFLTGNIWPGEVSKFRISAFGFDDYNSSDFIIRIGRTHYYGISLKKKPAENSADPTLINKAFDTVLEGSQFDEIKKNVTNIRVEYFADLVKKAHKKGILNIPNIKSLDDKELFEAKKRDKSIFERSYINTKGSISGGYNNDKAPDSMRNFVNSELAKTDNELFKKLTAVMDKNASVFANNLINLVLKVNLYDELSANRNLKNYQFRFALVTGVGRITKSGPQLGMGKATDLHTVLCGLSYLSANKKPYVIKEDKAQKQKSNAAKTFFKLLKNNVPILDMELRYKGTFSSQPQFFATITEDFMTILTEKCLVEP